MKIKRQKRVSRILAFFKANFDFREPYQVLIDGTFTNACLDMKVNIKEQLPKYFMSDEVKLLTSACCIREIEKLLQLEPKLFGAAAVLKRFPVHGCGHGNDPKPANKCLKVMASRSKYFVASQDPQLREKLRKIPGVGILYLHQKAPTLEKPSEVSREFVKNKVDLRMNEVEVIKRLKKEELGIDDDDRGQGSSRKRKRKKEPNPLSCLKSKKRPKLDTKPDVAPKNEEPKSGVKKKKKNRRGKRKKNPNDNN